MIEPSQIPDKMLAMMKPEDRKALGKAGLTFAEAQEKRAKRLEGEVQENIAALLRQRNIRFLRMRMDKPTTGTVGWPDFTFAFKGTPCAIEVKRPGELPTDEQRAVLADLMRDGWQVRVVFSEDGFLQFLAGLDSTTKTP